MRRVANADASARSGSLVYRDLHEIFSEIPSRKRINDIDDQRYAPLYLNRIIDNLFLENVFNFLQNNAYYIRQRKPQEKGCFACAT